MNNGLNGLPPGVSVAVSQYLCVRDEKTTTTVGGTSVAADITQTRTLNATQANTISGASLAANTITLPAGTYQVKATVPCGNVSGFQAFLYNSSDSTYALIGTSGNANAAANSNASFIGGQFTIASSKNFTIRHYTSAATATNGLGPPSSSGQTEVYTQVEIWKVA